MISQEELRKLFNGPAGSGGRVFSLYLNVEPEWEKTSRRKFETVFKTMTRALERECGPSERIALERDVRVAGHFLSDYKPRGRSLVLFADESEDFFWAREFQVPIPSQVRWRGKPYVLPLLEAMEEYQRIALVLVSKAQAKVVTFFLGEVEEERDALAASDVRHRRSAGHDNQRSQLKLQRTMEMHAGWHLKRVVAMLQELERCRPFERLVVSGPPEAAEEFCRLLPPRLQAKIAARLALPVHAQEKEIEEALLRLEARIERQKEGALVRRLTQDAVPGGRQSIFGIEAALKSGGKAQIRKLVYSDHFGAKGCRCTACGLFSTPGTRVCEACGSATESFSEVLEDLARKVIRKGGTIERVCGTAAALLDEAGGIGALTRL